MPYSFSNNQSFTLAASLAAWSPIYDLSAGVLRSQMRVAPGDPSVVYEWATANDARGTAKGTIDLLAVKALGSFTFSQNPAAGDAVTFGTTAVTFVSTTPVGTQVRIGATLEATLEALLLFLQGSADSQIILCTYSLAATTLLVEFKVTGTAGNAFEIGATSPLVLVSGHTLEQGGDTLVMSAPLADITGFLGTFYFDVRYEAPAVGGLPAIYAVLQRDTLTFNQGITL